MVKNRTLAQAISDASFAEFYAVLSFKAAWYGKEVVKVNRWFASSKPCSCCGWKNERLTLSDRIFICQSCGLKIDRDLNASENILKEALRVSNAIRTLSECQSV
jgi:putative transposase